MEPFQGATFQPNGYGLNVAIGNLTNNIKSRMPQRPFREELARKNLILIGRPNQLDRTRRQ